MTNNPATVNHGPLTTIFTPPASCALTTINDITSGWRHIFQALSGVPPPGGDAKYSTYKQCYPGTTTNSFNIDNWAEFYYSPGICPTGWPAACQLTQFPAGSLDKPSLFPTQTMGVVCCPTGRSCVTCGVPLPTSGGNTDLLMDACMPAGCQRRFTAGEVVTGYGMSANKEITITISRSVYNYMTGVPVLWESSDRDIVSLLGRGTDNLAQSVNARGGADAQPGGRTTGSSPTQASTDTTAIGDTSTSAQTSRQTLQNVGYSTSLDALPSGDTSVSGPANRSSSDIASKRITKAAKIVIGVLLPVFCLASFVAIFICWRRRTSRPQPEVDETRGKNLNMWSTQGEASSRIHELPGSYEMREEGKERRQWERHELDSSGTGEEKTTMFAMMSRWGRHELDGQEKHLSNSVGKTHSLPGVMDKVDSSDAARLSHPFVVQVTR